jgi:hypothetical protein
MTEADLEKLLGVQRESYGRAGCSLRGAWPEEFSLRGLELRERLDMRWRTRHGQAPDWAVALIELRPERILSYRDPHA